MSMITRRRYLHVAHEQQNPFSLLFVLSALKQLWYDRVTTEVAIYAYRTLRDLLLMGIELLIENTMVQVVSLLEHDRTPLRDLAKEYLQDKNQTLLKFAYMGTHTYQVDTNSVLFLWILYCCLHGSKGLQVLQKGVRCLTISRTIRIITFTMTILPNPNPSCKFTGPVNPFRPTPGRLYSK